MKSESLMWYKQPANMNKWTEALPVGNGRLGAMVFGGINFERIQLNEDSIWSDGYRDRHNPNAGDEINNIRTLLKDGKINEAEKLARYALTGTPEYQRVYQTLGDLDFTFHNIPAVSEYKRGLCLNEAITFVNFKVNGYNYSREVFASAPADAIIVKLTTDAPEGISFDVRLVRHLFCKNTGTLDGDRIFLYAENGGIEGITFHCIAAGENTGGEMAATGEYLVFRNVNEATIYITAATNFRHDDTLIACRNILSNARASRYDRLRSEHVDDYKSLANRMTLDLGKDVDELPTDERLELVKKGRTDLGLVALYFKFGRYLLISCSRPGSLPANLQGIWCNDFMPPWGSKYTININTQMNYWPAEICNLPECHEPLMAHIRRMHNKGVETAKRMYDARGFVAHHNTDIWGDCAPQDTWIPATYWVLGAAWLCLHIWEHYEYTLDKEFLAGNFDLIKDACLFFVDFLIENEQGELVISPSVSPENTYILPDGTEGTLCEGCTMDGQILLVLFNALIRSSQILDRDHDFAKQINEIKSKLPPIRIGKNGGIMEWPVERDEAEPGHRHMSHLFALFPGEGISPEKTPELAEAARKTLTMRLSRGGGHTGWSRAWIISFYAKLGDGNEAYHHFNELLCHSTLPNLFDDHPPFQIDGNFGATAAIAHMLVQSTANTIYILKALPDEWKTGKVTGLCAKGGIVVDIVWENNSLLNIKITAKEDYSGDIIYKGTVKFIELKKGEELEIQW